MAGANDYVTKPVDQMELNVRVHALTGLQASINERLEMDEANEVKIPPLSIQTLVENAVNHGVLKRIAGA